jgi:hypothetical protein
MAPERLLEAFADTDSGQPRESADAVERAKQRAVKKVDDALPQDLEQRAVVLDALLRRPGNREAAAEAGIRTAADFEFAEAAMTRAASARLALATSAIARSAPARAEAMAVACCAFNDAALAFALASPLVPFVASTLLAPALAPALAAARTPSARASGASSSRRGARAATALVLRKHTSPASRTACRRTLTRGTILDTSS